MAKRLISHNAEGLKTFFDYDPSSRRGYRFYEQDVEPSLDYSKALARDEDRAKRGIKQELQHVAHYPAVVVMKMMTEHHCNPMTDPGRALKIAKAHFRDCLTVKASAVCKTAAERKLVISK